MTLPKRHVLLLTFLAWLSMLGFDFLLRSGLLGGLYLQSSSFLLPQSAAFALIPVGYLSFLDTVGEIVGVRLPHPGRGDLAPTVCQFANGIFLLLTILLVWLMIRLNLAGGRQGARFGLELGGLVWGAFVLGLLSVSTASVSLLIGWFIGQTLELAIAGAVIGSGLAGMRLRRLFVVVIAFVLLSMVTTIILQSVGVVPTTRIP